MSITSFRDIEVSLQDTRASFRAISSDVRYLLDEPFALYLKFMDLIRPWTSGDDQEVYAIEVLATVVRRVVASIVLLESGLPQEAQMILRNALELMLIGIDIAYNDQSRERWKATVDDDLTSLDRREWHFKPSRIVKRISTNAGRIYPEVECELSSNIYEEWKRVSNMTVHAHSYAQINLLSDGKGAFQLLGLKTREDYARDFRAYGVFLFNVVSILMAVPKYKAKLEDTTLVNASVENLLAMYSSMQRRYSTSQVMYVEVTSKVELQAAIKSIGYPFDVSPIPDDAIIERAVFDFSDPLDPKMVIDYRLD